MTPLTVKHPAAFVDAEASSQAAIITGANILVTYWPQIRQGGRVRMHLLFVAGVGSGGYRAKLAQQDGPRNRGEDLGSGP